jgi:glutaredoxin
MAKQLLAEKDKFFEVVNCDEQLAADKPKLIQLFEGWASVRPTTFPIIFSPKGDFVGGFTDLDKLLDAEEEAALLKADEEKKKEYEKNFEKNCKSLLDEIVTKFNYDQLPEKMFFVGGVDFSTDLPRVVKTVFRLDDERLAKRKKAVEFLTKQNKPLPVGGNFSLESTGRFVLYADNSEGMFFVQRLFERDSSDDICHVLNLNNTPQNEGFLRYAFVPTKDCPTQKPSQDKDLVHKTAYSILMNMGIVEPKQDDDDGFVVGDDELGNM